MMDANTAYLYDDSSFISKNILSSGNIKKNETFNVTNEENITTDVDATGGVNSVTIYLMDNSFFTINLLRKGPLTGSQILFEFSLFIGGRFKVVNEMFSLWMISPLLEILLGGDDKPSEVRDKWEILLKKYSWKYKKYPKVDVPCLVIRRNFLMSIYKEVEILNYYQKNKYEIYSFFIKILFMDAKDEYLRGRYLVEKENENELTQILVFLSEYEVGTNKANQNILKELNKSLRPKHHTSYSSFFHDVSFKKIKEVFNESYSFNTNTSLSFNKKDSPIPLMVSFLDKVRTFSTYGSIFYKCYLSKESIKYLKGPVIKDTIFSKISQYLPTTFHPVIVWVNTHSLGIYEKKDYNVIHSTSISNVRWTVSPEIDNHIQSVYLFHDKGSSNFTEIAGESAFLLHLALSIITTTNNNNNNKDKF
ncbi:Band4.1 inhibitor LRP interactor [Strongyloides ratti]|uniref:Band4.1 inhibitor LRP interactor n=1 Tax=Strongyloides ratti TaxID=34506 RepID=A0A090MTY6_STRRB|nr:Band4.1 inhibitor LRP interactor [Strongyloides ratti]CEF61858.1 Band4.1 inhibitor LRP interactor [Strongyloides ratti]